VIDLYQIHWPEPDEDIEEGWGAMADLVKAGKVRFAGVSNFNVEQLKRIQPIHPVTSLQPPYSMFRRDVENELLGYCAENQIGVVAYSPMQAGLLTGKFTKERCANLPESDWRSRSPFFNEPQLSVNLQAIDLLKEIAGAKSVSVSQLALAWALRRTELTSAIVGSRKPEQIQETVRAGSLKLTEDDIAGIEEILKDRELAIANLDMSAFSGARF
jgi:aryl-alcohol dehydrogenase-like predicted oxidoreductase